MIIIDPYKSEEENNEPDKDNPIKANIIYSIYVLPIRVINYAIIFVYFTYYIITNKEFRGLSARLGKGELSALQVKEQARKIIETRFWISFSYFNKIPKNQIIISSLIYFLIYYFKFHVN